MNFTYLLRHYKLFQACVLFRCLCKILYVLLNFVDELSNIQEDPPAENQITEVKTDAQPAKGSTYMDMEEGEPKEGEVSQIDRQKNVQIN